MTAQTSHEHAKVQQGGGFSPGCAVVLVLIALTIILPRLIPVIQPHVALPADKILDSPLFTLIPGLGEMGQIFLTNTFVVWAIAVVLVLFMGFRVGRRVKQAMAQDEYVLTGFTDVFVSFIEVLYNLTESTAGKWTRQIFPYFATITMLVLVINWMELLPGIDTIGLVQPAHDSHYGYVVKDLGPIALLWGEAKELYHEEGNGHGKGEEESHGALTRYGHAGAEKVEVYEFRPFFRVTSTDLNFTLALALVSVIMTQVIGLRAQGLHYLEKFFNFRALTRGPMGALDFAVGLLELISEFSKILSFSFRLFGNIFAGSVLLFVMGALAPPILFGFYGLELFVGLIQAFVFGILTMVFMAQATQHH